MPETDEPRHPGSFKSRKTTPLPFWDHRWLGGVECVVICGHEPVTPTVALPLIVRKFTRRAKNAFNRKNCCFSLPLTIRLLLPVTLGMPPSAQNRTPPDRLPVEPAALEV
jgi:hypothetical protein